MRFYPHERIGLFVDGPNLWETAKAMGLDIDYHRLQVVFADQATLICSHYFTPLDDRQEDFTPLRPLVDWLEYNGWSVTTRNKDTDVDLAVMMMEVAGTLEHLVLFSGDSDFCSLVIALQRLGKRVTVVSGLKNCSDELRRIASFFVDLEDLRAGIARPPRQVRLGASA